MEPEKWEEFKKLIEEIEHSPGQKVIEEVDGLKRGLRMVKRNKDELIKVLQVLKQPGITPKLWSLSRRDALHTLMEEVGRLLHNFLSSAFSLVDYMRSHRKHLYLNSEFNQEIEAEIQKRFINDDDHLIAQGLRNYIIHIGFPPVGATLHYADGDKDFNSDFNISIESLLKWDEWSGKQKQALARIGDTVEILLFAERYFKKVESFYLWLWSRQEGIHKKEIDDANQLRERARAIEQEGRKK